MLIVYLPKWPNYPNICNRRWHHHVEVRVTKGYAKDDKKPVSLCNIPENPAKTHVKYPILVSIRFL